MNFSTTFKQVGKYLIYLGLLYVVDHSVWTLVSVGMGTHTHAESSMKKIREGASRTCQRPLILGEEGGREDC